MSASLEARVDRLEEALMKLAYAQFNTEVELQKLSREMAAFREEIRQDTKALKEEMAAFKEELRQDTKALKEEMAAFKEELRQDTKAFKEEMLAFKETLHAEMTAFREEIRQDTKTFKEEMLAFKETLHAEMTAFREETRQDTKAFKEEMLAFKEEIRQDTKALKEEMAAFKEESRAERREMNKRWGEISNKLGTVVEDIIYPGFVGIAYTYFGAQDTELEAQRIKRKSQKDPSVRREFDGVIAWDGKLMLLEAKAAIRPEYLKAFAEFVERGQVFDYFPEYRGREFIPVFGALSIPESDVAFLTQKKIYCLAMGEEAMELLNGPEVDGFKKTSR